MTSLELLTEIFQSNSVKDQYGNSFNLNSNIDVQEGHLLSKLIVENKFSKSIEIGCAYGISSLYITSALSGENVSHTIIDPFQSSDWKGIGINNLKRAGFTKYKLIEELSETALPKLLEQRQSYDFGFIDGWHTFDHTLLDFFYINRMLTVGGIIVIDDVGLLSVNKAIQYILNYPAYKLEAFIKLDLTPSRKLFNNLFLKPVQNLTHAMPGKIKSEVFSNKILQQKLPVPASLVALRKVAEDERPWHWYKEF